MKPHEVVKALEDGKVIDDVDGIQYQYVDVTLYSNDGSGWLPRAGGMNLPRILQNPQIFKVVE